MWCQVWVKLFRFLNVAFEALPTPAVSSLVSLTPGSSAVEQESRAWDGMEVT